MTFGAAALLLLLPSYAPDRPPRGPAEPVRYGLLRLEIDPSDAHVALDGEFLDRGVWLISTSPGLHDVAVRKQGYRPWYRRVGIGPGEKLRLVVRLEPEILR